MVTFAAVPMTEIVGDFVVTGTAERRMIDGEPSTVLTSVAISLASDAPSATTARGITTGAMRRAESAVKRMAEKARQSDSAMTAMHERNARLKVDALQGRTPRGDATYYRDLLDASDALQLAGDRQSLTTLASALGASKSTLATRLLAARRERDDAIKRAETEGAI